MEKYFRDEIFTRQLALILIKSGLSATASYYMTKGSNDVISNVILLQIFVFLTVYMLCSIFHVNIKMTGNYIIGFFTGCASVFIGFSVASNLEENLGSGFGLILMILLFVGFLIYDICKIIRIMKIPVD